MRTWLLAIAISSSPALAGKATFEIGAIGNVMKVTGENGLVEGKLVIADGKASGKFKVLLSSFTTGVSLRDQHMRGDLRVAASPVATYRMFPAPFTGSEQFPFNGTLELNGIKRPLSGTAAFTGKTLNATLMIKLEDYALHQRRIFGIGVADTATVKVEVTD